MITMMKESDDVLARCLAEKLAPTAGVGSHRSEISPASPTVTPATSIDADSN